MQYRNAKALLATINEDRPPREPYYRHCLNAIAFACFLPIRILDWLRVSRFGRFLVKKGLVRDRPLLEIDGESAFAKGSDVRREARANSKLEDANLTWTMSMAFYALGGGCVYISKTGEQRTLRENAIVYSADMSPGAYYSYKERSYRIRARLMQSGKPLLAYKRFSSARNVSHASVET
jgi:hypothetical protein